MPGFDRHEATAEARLDRLVDRAEESVRRRADREDGGGLIGQSWSVSERELDDGMQVRSGDDDLPTEVDEWVAVRDDDVVDAIAEAFNARDLDRLHELTTADCEVLGLQAASDRLDPAVPDLWERRPSILVTRVVDEDRALGVLWERAASDAWAAVATVHVVVDDDLVQVLEFSDDVDLIERLGPVAPTADDDFWPEVDGLDDSSS